MQGKWIGLTAVLLIAAGIIGYKIHAPRPEPLAAGLPRVLLVAELAEANASGDGCAEIIHLVRAARNRGISVQELEPGSKSDLLTRYHVLTIPTVLILDKDGKPVSRYEGEGRDTVKSIRAGLEQLQ